MSAAARAVYDGGVFAVSSLSLLPLNACRVRRTALTLRDRTSSLGPEGVPVRFLRGGRCAIRFNYLNRIG